MSLRFVYVGLVVAAISSSFIFGLVFYARMAREVADSNHLQHEAEDTRTHSQNLQQSEQLSSLEALAKEVPATHGIEQKLNEPSDILARGKIAPTFSETVAEYNRLRGPKLSGFEVARRWHVHTRPEIWPVDGPLMSSYGHRTDPFSGEGAYHTGVDISARVGTPAVATADGIVVFADHYGGYGRLVVVDHGNGYETYYAHLSRFHVVVGHEIRQGEPVGEIGTSGRVTAPHLHYEIRVRKTPVNPYRYLVANNLK